MPSAYSAVQKGAIAQFVGFTQAKDSVAAKVSQIFEKKLRILKQRADLSVFYIGKNEWLMLGMADTQATWVERRASN